MAAGNIDWLDLGTLACLIVAIGMLAFSARDIRDAFAEEFGDVPEVPAEAKRAVGAKILGGGGNDNPQRLGTHSGDPLHTDRRGGF